jgi:pSer/pThr/pTyr-binding forkhead associated (FHA) protein
MATLTLKREDGSAVDYTINQGETLTIGRKETNTIVLDNLIVSGLHAKIDAFDDRFLLTDLKSKNGTYVNGAPVATHWLRDGDVITIGKQELVFSLALLEAVSSNVSEEEDEFDKTMVLDSERLEEFRQQSLQAQITYLKGGQGDVLLTRKLTKIGKDPSNDVVVGGLTVGKVAATISRRPDGFYLNYVSGLAKPKVNGRVVTRSQPIDDFDTIELGGSKLQFFLK